MSQTPDLEILGLISTQYSSESHAPKTGLIDKAYLAAHAKAHEYAGFDRVLIGYNSASPDGFQVAAYAATQTSKLKFLLAHRPGFTSPTLAARQLATLDHLSEGRLALHVITGGSDEEQARDGDFLTKAERYARSDEYITVLRKAWTSDGPFDHDGPHYRVKGALAAVRTLQQPHIPIFFGGASDEAVEIAARPAGGYTQ
jgi:alkanesulfonate monooxygenase